MSIASKTELRPWRSMLLQTVLSLLWFLSFGGFALFFVGPQLHSRPTVAQTHYILGLAFFGIYLPYQLRHYRAVSRFRAQIHYTLGLCLMGAVLATTLSGALLQSVTLGRRLIDLAHIMCGFALLIFLVCHLALVLRIQFQRHNHSKSTHFARFVLSTTGLWIPVAIGALALAVLSGF